MTEPVQAENAVDINANQDAAFAWTVLREAQKRVDEAAQELKRAREIFDQIVGNCEVVTAAGRELAFYRHDGRFSPKQFTQDLPHLADKFTRWKAKPFIDEEALKAEHPMLYKQYRARTLRITGEGR
jgi:hypothetical protein